MSDVQGCYVLLSPWLPWVLVAVIWLLAAGVLIAVAWYEVCYCATLREERKLKGGLYD